MTGHPRIPEKKTGINPEKGTMHHISITYLRLGVPSGKCQRGEFVYLLWNVPIQIFFHNFRGLKWIPLTKRMAPNFKTTTLAHSRPSLLLNNNNMA